MQHHSNNIGDAEHVEIILQICGFALLAFFKAFGDARLSRETASTDSLEN
jgi:hypothetical protein